MGNRVFLKRVKGECLQCYFYLWECIAYKYDIDLDCGDKGKIYKQINFERVEGLCNDCYFYLRDEPFCSFPKYKESDCVSKGIHKLK